MTFSMEIRWDSMDFPSKKVPVLYSIGVRVKYQFHVVFMEISHIFAPWNSVGHEIETAFLQDRRHI